MHVVLDDDSKSRLQECANLFGVPLNAETGILEDSLMPTLPKALRHLRLARDVFNGGRFDPAVKQRLLAALLCYSKSDRILKDSSRWNGNPNVSPSSSKYQGPPGLRLK